MYFCSTQLSHEYFVRSTRSRERSGVSAVHHLFAELEPSKACIGHMYALVVPCFEFWGRSYTLGKVRFKTSWSRKQLVLDYRNPQPESLHEPTHHLSLWQVSLLLCCRPTKLLNLAADGIFSWHCHIAWGCCSRSMCLHAIGVGELLHGRAPVLPIFKRKMTKSFAKCAVISFECTVCLQMIRSDGQLLSP